MDDRCEQVNCQLVTELAKRVEKMECDIDNHALLIASNDKKASISEVILDRVEKSLGEVARVIGVFEKTMSSIEKSMVQMQSGIANNADATNQIQSEIISIKKKFEEAENKSKIDWRDIVKEVLTKKLTWLVGGGLLIYAISQFISK